MTTPTAAEPAERILAAAALEFAGRGFAGATVDTIARRARVNKAMIYYYFGSKRSLYRTLLRRMFSNAGRRLQRIADSGNTPAEKMDLAIAEFADLIREEAHLPAIMLREVAEGGARLDAETLASLASVPRAVVAIVKEGISRGIFRPVNPLFAHFTLLVPIVFYRAGAPIRKEIAHLHLLDTPAMSVDDFVEHMQDAARRALAVDVQQTRSQR